MLIINILIMQMSTSSQSQGASTLETNRVYPGISAYAWNSDCSKIALCPGTSREIWIFKTNGTMDTTKWLRTQVSTEHLNPISGLDWHPTTDKLLSCSIDRGAIVWTAGADDKLIPGLCMIKESKANTACQWNHRGDKFAVATASGNLFVGTYNADQGFWAALNLSGKKPHHKSSVLSCTFEPLSGRAIVSTSADNFVYLSTCFDSGVDQDSAGPFGKIESFGEVLLKFNCDGWPNTAHFSPDSAQLVYATQDCEVNFVDLSGAPEGKKNKP
jgi:actin related protein 2/3 complex subunit 1A/1B